MEEGDGEGKGGGAGGGGGTDANTLKYIHGNEQTRISTYIPITKSTIKVNKGTFSSFVEASFVHPMQDVALHQCLPLSSVCCFPVSPFT